MLLRAAQLAVAPTMDADLEASLQHAITSTAATFTEVHNALRDTTREWAALVPVAKEQLLGAQSSIAAPTTTSTPPKQRDAD